MIKYNKIKLGNTIVGSTIFILIILSCMNFVEIQFLKKKLSSNRIQINRIKRQIISIRSTNYDNESEIQDLLSRIDDLEGQIDNTRMRYIPFNLD